MQAAEKKQPIVTFHRIVESAPLPLRADKSALGTLPAAAFQYCEAVRAASGWGWYVFPPVDIHLLWNGVDIDYQVEGQWQRLKSIGLSDAFADAWDEHAPEPLQGCWPPFMTAIPSPGVVQVWTGYLVSTAPGWSVDVGPLANIRQSRDFACFEGLIETDSFKPCPLFMNIQLQATDREIVMPRSRPLFQVRALRRDSYLEPAHVVEHREGLAPRVGDSGGMTEEDWAGYAKTVRRIDAPAGSHTPGQYGAGRRRSARSGE